MAKKVSRDIYLAAVTNYLEDPNPETAAALIASDELYRKRTRSDLIKPTMRGLMRALRQHANARVG
jgi:hypothetical protein